MADTLRHLDPYGGRAKSGVPIPTTPLWRRREEHQLCARLTALMQETIDLQQQVLFANSVAARWKLRSSEWEALAYRLAGRTRRRHRRVRRLIDRHGRDAWVAGGLAGALLLAVLMTVAGR